MASPYLRPTAVCHWIDTNFKNHHSINMKEIFISHSSANKDFANILRDEIGKDRCIIDCADFEPMKKSEDEIRRWFEECHIFVLLLSKEALSSPWVKKEIEMAEARFYSPKRKNFIFLPLIIDSRITHKSIEIPEWIREDECFNLKFFKSPVIAMHLILKELREFLWKRNDVLRQSENIFIGRKKELGEFEAELNKTSRQHLNGAIISGRSGIGKKAFTRQCIISEMKESPAFVPYKLTMREKDNIEDYILQINDFLHYPKEKIEHILSLSKDKKLREAVKLTNELYAYKAYIFITDKMGCVNYNGRLTDWFHDLITHSELIKELKIFVLSEVQWDAYDASKYQNLISINLLAISVEERKMLFNRCCQIQGVNGLQDSEINSIVRRLNQTPSQIVKIVSEIKKHPLTKDRIIKKMEEEADGQINTILQPFLKEHLAIEILLILSKFEFLSHRLLKKMFRDQENELQGMIYEMIDFNIAEEFGSEDAYVRLDASIMDYMKRSKFKLSEEKSSLVSEIIEDMVHEETEIDDMSSYLIEQRSNLESQLIGTDKLKILVPSVAIKYVIESYYARRYDSVVRLCKRLLSDMHNFYPQIKRELSYWLALSYARLDKERELFDSLDSLNRSDSLFILGFYYRKKGQLEDALECLEGAQKLNHDTNKVRRELVSVHLGLGNIDEALRLAEINYAQRPSNAFHIQAYFQCLNAKPQRTAKDIEIQKRLLDEMQKSNAKSARSMYEAMVREFII